MILPEMLIPYDQLSPETLDALIEEFITRHGAVHGHDETPLERLIAQVKAQLRQGKVAISYDEEAETCNIVPVERPRRGPESGEEREQWEQ
jgi:uncharacterized protein